MVSASRFLAPALACTFAASASGAVLVEERFECDTSTPVDGANGGTGWSGGWLTNAGLTYAFQAQDVVAPTGDDAVGNQLFIDPGATDDDAGGTTPNIRRKLATPISADAAQTIFISSLYRREDVTNINGSENSGVLRFNDASGARQISLGHSSTEQLEISFIDATAGFTNVTSPTVDFEIGTDYLIVGRIDLAGGPTNDTIRVSLFETGDSISEPVAYDLVATGDVTGLLSQFQYGLTRRGGRGFTDELKIGETFADVVPEPASALLVAGGAACLLGRRRAAA